MLSWCSLPLDRRPVKLKADFAGKSPTLHLGVVVNIKNETKPRSKKSQPKSKSKKAPNLPQEPKVPAYPNIQDEFQQRAQDMEQQHIREEHEIKLLAQQKLHEAKIASVMAELQTQLYKIWNEMWLQRQKSLNDGFKQWLKVFSAG